MKNLSLFSLAIIILFIFSFNINALDNKFIEGKKAFEKRNYTQAIEIFSKILQNDSNNKIVRYYLGQSYYKINNYNEALKHFKYVYDKSPESLEGKYSKVAINQILDLKTTKKWKQKVDIPNHNAQQGNYLKEISLEGQFIRWNLNSMPLKIYIEKNPKNVKYFDSKLIDYIKSGIEEWPKVTNGKILYTYTDVLTEADIVITWVKSERDLPALGSNNMDFLGLTKLIATTKDLYGAVIYMATSASNSSTIPADVFKGTALHEMGHALGLQGHSNNPDDVMFFSLSQYNRFNKLTRNDITTINMLYSKKPHITSNGSGKLINQCPPELKKTLGLP